MFFTSVMNAYAGGKGSLPKYVRNGVGGCLGRLRTELANGIKGVGGCLPDRRKIANVFWKRSLTGSDDTSGIILPGPKSFRNTTMQRVFGSFRKCFWLVNTAA